MYSLKERINVLDEANKANVASGGSGATRISGTKQVGDSQGASAVQQQQGPSILAAKRRRHLHPFFFHMGPVALSVTSVLLIGLMAVLYLSQVGQAVADNQKIQSIHVQQSDLQRQNQDLINTISTEQSPAYIASMARKMGLVPGDPNSVQVIKAKNLKPVPNDTQTIQP